MTSVTQVRQLRLGKGEKQRPGLVLTPSLHVRCFGVSLHPTAGRKGTESWTGLVLAQRARQVLIKKRENEKGKEGVTEGPDPLSPDDYSWRVQSGRVEVWPSPGHGPKSRRVLSSRPGSDSLQARSRVEKSPCETVKSMHKFPDSLSC